MIELLASSGTDHTISSAARVSFADGSNWGEIPEGYTEERSHKLIKYLAEHKHMCVFRHTMVTLRCKMPIFIARQLGKHQVGLTWSEVSRRYVDTGFEFHIPTDIRARPTGGIKQGSAGTVEFPEAAKQIFASNVVSCKANYDQLIAHGVAPEQARMVLPQSMMTTWVWTGNILAFAHVYNERIAAGAQLEAREFAEALDKVMSPLFPLAWAALTQRSKTNGT